jgi:hypothetical protein
MTIAACVGIPTEILETIAALRVTDRPAALAEAVGLRSDGEQRALIVGEAGVSGRLFAAGEIDAMRRSRRLRPGGPCSAAVAAAPYK